MMQHSPSEEDLIGLETLLLTGKHKEASQKCIHQLDELHHLKHELQKSKHEKTKDEYDEEKKALRDR